ncbi:DNA-directed RNA polymerase subunit alpha C-terminal domain-containing protein [Arenibacter latericius]|uniref:DNA-directed RNA polymerase subunit alpha C-terminal domain-containing protein n=1 Tax=Arenibacter latericius TaxID=86104 RepID=UPI000403C393|nr:DNA-directed RNA polymerase subunit alpha C-terminal domain-containing protein [Arenibacter latericius]MDX1365191.1 DNA-directed RNA polymerase subunit alpha C-terminal domain-containing protein [Arenibacter latericius]
MRRINKEDEVTYHEFLEALAVVKAFRKQISELFREVDGEVGSLSKFIGVNKDTKIYRLPLSTRAMNVLKAMDGIDVLEGTTEDLAKISLRDLLKTPHAGHKTIDEFQELCLFVNLPMKR